MKQNLEQKRAHYALTTIKEHLEHFEEDQQERYLNRTKNLPAMILMCGLGQAVATLQSVGKGQKENPDQVLYNDLERWLCGNEDILLYKDGDLLNEIATNDRDVYMEAQAEALKILEWLKKLATAYLSKEGGDK